MYLTQRQREIASIIDKHIDTHGSSPTVREIAASANISPKAVHDHINALVAKGYYERSPHKSRSLRWSQTNEKIKTKSHISTPVKAPVTTDSMPLFDKEYKETQEVVFIQNTSPSYAHYDEYIVDSASMQSYGIQKGDIAIIKTDVKKDQLKNGDIIAIQTSSSPFEIYKYSKDAARIKLKNDNIKQLYMKDINLLGVIVEIRRKYR